MINIHPRLAFGIWLLALFLIFLLLEIATGLPLLSDYMRYVGGFTIASGIIVGMIFDKRYDDEEGTDPRAYIVFIILAVSFIALAWVM